MTPEGKVKQAARKLYKQYGAYVEQNTASVMGSNGSPDQKVSRKPDGHFAGVETKADSWTVTALQRIHLNEIAATGGSAMVVNQRNLAMLEDWLKSPGWRVYAEFDEKNKVVCHWAQSGDQRVQIKNPPPKGRKP